MRRLLFIPSRFLIALLAVSLVLMTPDLLHALQDSTAVQDRTGLVGAVIDKWWLLVSTFLTSTTLKVINLLSAKTAKWPEPLQWTALYVIALIWNLFAKYAGIAEVDALAPVFLASFVQTGVAGLIYKWGGHKVPVVAVPVSGGGPSTPMGRTA